jgi:Uma2 family endonuclease
MVVSDVSPVHGFPVLTELLPGGSSLCISMTFEEYMAHGETHHDEYYDGLVFVNPPTEHHVRVARRLTRLLEDACPSGYEVAPEWGWQTAPQVVFRPDIMVYAPRSRYARLLEFPPLLVVEVLSPSTRREDWGRKRELYAQAGASSYWIVDPDAEDITVMANVDGQFSIIARLAEGSAQGLAEPFSVTVDLAALFA